MAPPKAGSTPETPYGPADDPLWMAGSKVWAPLSGRWLEALPEELVRQRFIYELHTEFGYDLSQMAQERRTMHGHSSPRADIVVASDAIALAENRDFVLVVETKADTVPIMSEDYVQGESYARAVGAEFLVLHNSVDSRCFRLIPGAPGRKVELEVVPSVEVIRSRTALEQVRKKTKAFTRDEFRRLLFECHSILRDNHKLEPGSAFDEISKILFVKMAFERSGERERFTEAFIDRYAKVRRRSPETIINDLFSDTKDRYRADDLFAADEQIRVSLQTFRRIVGELERFDLSSTSDDVKGIAFESFLGETFRGELGQFFTPRPIVDFMVEMLDPKEGELICDPASGTGGFLIKAFEYVRDAIYEDVRGDKARLQAELEAMADLKDWSPDRLAEELEARMSEASKALDPQEPESRMGILARSCIYGVDAEARAARTSKMNMIMHGDGHGGIHYHDGLLDTDGVFPDRFDVVLTNPPFGSNVGADQIVGATEQTTVEDDPAEIARCETLYGPGWRASHDRLAAAARTGTPILALYDIGRDPIGPMKQGTKVRRSRSTETLFVERALDLLKPGGRMGIVLPDGILSNSSMQWLRDYVYGRARLLAVVSIPHDVFSSAKATVKTSLVFLQRFTADEAEAWAQAEEQGAAAAEEWRLEREQLIVDEARKRAPEGLAPLIETPNGSIISRAERARLLNEASSEDVDALRQLEKETRKALNEAGRQAADLKSVESRRRFSYPVFLAEVVHAGITATGDTGPDVANELPEVVAAYRRFLADPEAAAVVDS